MVRVHGACGVCPVRPRESHGECEQAASDFPLQVERRRSAFQDEAVRLDDEVAAGNRLRATRYAVS